MMGETTDDLDRPVTKTATGVVVLPRDHHVIERKLKTPTTKAKIGKSACDQCRYCTEFCRGSFSATKWNPTKSDAQPRLHRDRLGRGGTNGPRSAAPAGSARSTPARRSSIRRGMRRRRNRDASGKLQVGPARPRSKSTHAGRTPRPDQVACEKLHVGAYDVPAPMTKIELPVKQIHLPLKQSAGHPGVAVGQGGRYRPGRPGGCRTGTESPRRDHPLPVCSHRQRRHIRPHHAYQEMNAKSVGLIELSSIAAGFSVADSALKAGMSNSSSPARSARENT